MPPFTERPRKLRNVGGLAGAGLFVGMGLLFGLFVSAIALVKKDPGLARDLPTILSIAAAVCLLGAAGMLYAARFFVLLSKDGIVREAPWPFRKLSLPWKELARVDYFVQQRRLGLGGRPDAMGAPLGKIAGFRFWRREGKPFQFDGQFFTYAKEKELIWEIFHSVVAPALRKSAERGQTATAVVRQGAAGQEDGFAGDVLMRLADVVELKYDRDLLELVPLQGKGHRISFGERAGAGEGFESEGDHIVVELAWGRPLDVGKHRTK